MSNPLRDAIQDAPRVTWLDRLALASLEAAESKFYPSANRPMLTVSLQASEINAWDTARVTMAVQSATAKLGHLIRDPKTQSAQSRRTYREAAPLIPRGQSGGTLFFGFPEPPPETHESELLFDVRAASLPERAAVDLIALLPRGSNDDKTLEAVLARRVTERSAIADMVRAVQATESGVTLEFTDFVGHSVESVLLRDQASTLEDTLRETQIARRTLTFTGTLDGMRTQRRIFYLLEENGREISGGVDTDQLTDLREHIGDIVTATVEEVVTIEQSGKRSRPSFRLLNLDRPPSLFDE